MRRGLGAGRREGEGRGRVKQGRGDGGAGGLVERGEAGPSDGLTAGVSGLRWGAAAAWVACSGGWTGMGFGMIGGVS